MTGEPRATEVQQRPSRVVLVAAHLAMLPPGAMLALYGPSLPGVADRFALEVSTAGLLLGAHGLGTVLGMVIWALCIDRLPAPRFCAAASTGLALACLGVAVASSWPLLLVAAVFVGIGFAATINSINIWIAGAYGGRSAAMLNLLAGVFGVGAIMSPVVLSVLGPSRYPVTFAVFAVPALVAALPLARAAPWRPPPAPAVAATTAKPVAAAFMLALALYVGLESGTGGWAASHLVATGRDPALAALVSAAFWATFTAARFGAAPLALRVPVERFLLGALILAVGTLAVAVWSPWAIGAYLMAGVALAPIFPLLFAWFIRIFGQSRLVLVLLFVSGSAGATLLPPLVGFVFARTGPQAIPLGLAAAAVGCALTVSWLRRRTAAVAAPDLSPAPER